MVMLTGKAEAQVTDSDSGPHADGAGHGRGSNHIRGCTDNDSGSNADQAGNGRGNRHSRQRFRAECRSRQLRPPPLGLKQPKLRPAPPSPAARVFFVRGTGYDERRA